MRSETLLIAIRAKCLDCSGFQRQEVERCKLADCPLHPYRSVKAISNEENQRTELEGQMNLFEILRQGGQAYGA